MSAQPQKQHLFTRRTDLRPEERHVDFEQIDRTVYRILHSQEAMNTTTRMFDIYAGLVFADLKYRVRDRVLFFESEIRGGKRVRASRVLAEAVHASPTIVSKALRWMHQRGVIGYCPSHNGQGITIYLNYAEASIRRSKKILAFPSGPPKTEGNPSNGPVFKEHGFRPVRNMDLDTPPAQNTSAEGVLSDEKILQSAHLPGEGRAPAEARENILRQAERRKDEPMITLAALEWIVDHVTDKLRPAIQTSAEKLISRQQSETREWLDRRVFPKIARVAQAEAYKILNRAEGGRSSGGRSQPGLYVGKAPEHEPAPVEDELLIQYANLCLSHAGGDGEKIENLLEYWAEETRLIVREDIPRIKDAALSLIAGRRGAG